MVLWSGFGRGWRAILAGLGCYGSSDFTGVRRGCYWHVCVSARFFDLSFKIKAVVILWSGVKKVVVRAMPRLAGPSAVLG